MALTTPIELSRHVKVGRAPPDERELAALHHDGVCAIIDLRTDTEPFGAAPTPIEEAANARALGIEYIRVPVLASHVTRADLDRVGKALRDAPKPVLIHCGTGRRAGMAALVQTAVETGTPGTEMLEMARRLDVLLGDHAQQQIFVEYVDRREIQPNLFRRRQEALRSDGGPTLAFAFPRRTSSWRSPPVSLGRTAIVAGAILLLLDRRLLVPVLLAAGVVAGRAVTMLRAQPPFTPPPADPALDREITELGRRVRRLGASA